MSFPCDSKIHHCVHVKRHVTPKNVVLHIPHVVASIMPNLLIYIKFVAMILTKWNGGHNISFVLNIHPNLVITQSWIGCCWRLNNIQAQCEGIQTKKRKKGARCPMPQSVDACCTLVSTRITQAYLTRAIAMLTQSQHRSIPP